MITISDSLHKIYEYLTSLKVFSDHEHHLSDEFFKEDITLDKLIKNSYVAWTGYISDGTEASRKRLLENVRFNSYFYWFEKGLQQVHDIEQLITVENWDKISKIVEKNHKENKDFHWKSLIKNGYQRIINDTYWNPGEDNGHPEIFIPTFRIDKFMYGFHKEAEAPDEFYTWKRYDFKGKSLNDFVEMMYTIIKDQYYQGKVVALKCAEAYNRSLSFLPDDKVAAEEAFGTHPEDITEKQKMLFGNYIFNRCCELAQDLDIPFQIHTGLAQLSGSNPMRLQRLISKYPETHFVLFHAGYPWIHEVAGLAHNYNNVYPSLTWTATISTSTAIRALDEYIDVTPSINTITWGSDCWVPEESIGAMLAWRFIVAKVLAQRFDDGRLTVKDAEILGRKFMFENGNRIYRKHQ